jgi:hypothetical protein
MRIIDAADARKAVAQPVRLGDGFLDPVEAVHRGQRPERRLGEDEAFARHVDEHGGRVARRGDAPRAAHPARAEEAAARSSVAGTRGACCRLGLTPSPPRQSAR